MIPRPKHLIGYDALVPISVEGVLRIAVSCTRCGIQQNTGFDTRFPAGRICRDMRQEGWKIVRDGVKAVCPSCLKNKREEEDESLVLASLDAQRAKAGMPKMAPVVKVALALPPAQAPSAELSTTRPTPPTAPLPPIPPAPPTMDKPKTKPLIRAGRKSPTTPPSTAESKTTVVPAATPAPQPRPRPTPSTASAPMTSAPVGNAHQVGAESEKKVSVQESAAPTPASTTPAPMPTPTPAPQEKDMQIQESRDAMRAQVQMHALLSQHFAIVKGTVPPKGEYDAGWSDERVARETGLSLSVVTQWREFGYGQIDDPRLRTMQADLAKLKAQLEADEKALREVVSDYVKLGTERIARLELEISRLANRSRV